MSDLEQIVDGVEPEQETPDAVEAPEPEQDAEPETPQPEEAEVKPEPKPEQTVPLAALLEVRQELQALKSLATPKVAPTPAPDVFEDPEGYQKHMRGVVEQASVNQKLEMSRFMAEREYGKDQVDAMFEYFNEHPEQSQQFLSAPSPFHAGMDFFNQQRVATEIGSDPAAYKQKLEAEIRAKVEAEMVAKQARDTAGKFAPSMANVTGTGGGPRTSFTGPTDLTSILGE